MSASASKTLLVTGACGVSAAFLCTYLVAQQSDRTRLLQSQEQADSKSTGCVSCHGLTDFPVDAHDGHGALRLHGLPRRRCRNSAAFWNKIRGRTL